MDSTRKQMDAGQASTRYQAIRDVDSIDGGECDDIGSVKLASSARRYQPDVRSNMGRCRAPNSAIPPRSTVTKAHVPITQAHPRLFGGEGDAFSRETDEYRAPNIFRGRRPHWTVLAGGTLLIMLLGWIALSAIGSWWQTTLDDWRYGRPRTFQTDAVVGHHDSSQNPSHFMALNLDRHILVIEIPGGDASKSVVYSGPTLVGPGQDLTPVTLSFQDVNHDGKPDMILNIQGNQIVYLNGNGTFVAPGPGQNPGSSP